MREPFLNGTDGALRALSAAAKIRADIVGTPQIQKFLLHTNKDIIVPFTLHFQFLYIPESCSFHHFG